ncbi:hypothetical protein MGALJ_05100 [Mycobacterium gallinarum]|uniref:Uncharacterized protein n=1 Tax=Mycobacterium gallinarum TaxID=39689 RepID=A0A9W4AYP1_9MYCO|nr:hypothetical protein MGALJ_05100 [Mycobacterium gallinarum]
MAAVLADPVLPPGDDERFVGFGIMGLPFANGHYLAMRQIPATTFAPPYVSVWHRDPSCKWTFYATTPGQQSCARYFSSATPNDAVQCDIDVTWTGPQSVQVDVPDVLRWTLALHPTRATRLMGKISGRVSDAAWTNPVLLHRLGRVARRTLDVGDVRLTGRAPNGQCYSMAPKQVWLVADSHAVLMGRDLGPSGPLLRQARLGDFRMPQRGIGMVGSGHFETFDPHRHRSAEREAAYA